MVHALIFDLDGTLVDSLPDLEAAVNGALLAQDYPAREAGLFRLMVGDGFTELVRRAAPPGLGSDEFGRLRAAAAAAYEARALESTRPYPGIPESLQAFAARRLPLAVLTNKPEGIARLVVAGLFPRISFFEVRGEKPDFPRKPDPASALDLAGRMGLAPAEIGFIGDSGVDMATALAAGMQPFGVLWGYRDEAELLAAGAARLFRRPAELFDLGAEAKPALA
jgi:phosphoglycolate phosphatase